mgnify:FL=1
MKKTAERIDKIMDEMDSSLTNIEEALAKYEKTKEE